MIIINNTSPIIIIIINYDYLLSLHQYIQTHRHTYIHTYAQARRQTYRQTVSQSGRLNDKNVQYNNNNDDNTTDTVVVK